MCDFFDRHKPTDNGRSAGSADLQLVPLGAGVAGCMVPSKVYGILAAGKPFVAMMECEAEVARIARDFECGICRASRRRRALADTISRCMNAPELLEEMGRRARRLAEQSMTVGGHTKVCGIFWEIFRCESPTNLHRSRATRPTARRRKSRASRSMPAD